MSTVCELENGPVEIVDVSISYGDFSFGDYLPLYPMLSPSSLGDVQVGHLPTPDHGPARTVFHQALVIHFLTGQSLRPRSPHGSEIYVYHESTQRTCVLIVSKHVESELRI